MKIRRQGRIQRTYNTSRRNNTKKPSQHYGHIEIAIIGYFKKRGISAVIEPHGSRGPDIEDNNGIQIVGEIKNDIEITRDLKGYWGLWNSTAQFGGKTKEFKLRKKLPSGVDELKPAVKGWIATILGQLHNYVTKAKLVEGWLVVENVDEFKQDILAAIMYLIENNKVYKYSEDVYDNIGYYCISYVL